jgi:protein gp37
MGKVSSIQWTHATWNVAVGCKKVDADCKYCYMYRQSLKGTRYDPKSIRKTKTVFDLPLRLKGPHLIFTSSLTDFFLPELDGWRAEAWDIIRQAQHHTYQILTKRPERILDCLPSYWEEIKHCVWLGTSVGHQAAQDRIKRLVIPIQPGVTKFVSVEPLHEKMHLGLHEQVDMGHRVGDLIDWIIIGGESGNDTGQYRYRPCSLEWIGDLILEAEAYDIPVFVKQLGTHLAKEMGLKDRHGGDVEEWPEWLKRREFPNLKFAKTSHL